MKHCPIKANVYTSIPDNNFPLSRFLVVGNIYKYIFSRSNNSQNKIFHSFYKTNYTIVIICFSGSTKYRRKSVCALKIKYCSRISKIIFHDKCVTAQRLLQNGIKYFSCSLKVNIFNNTQYDQVVYSSVKLIMIFLRMSGESIYLYEFWCSDYA